MSKRQEMREERQKLNRTRWMVMGGFILLGVIITGAVIIYNSYVPANDVVLPDPQLRPEARENHLGNPMAPVKVEAFADFQCPACQQYGMLIEPQILREYVATGLVYYTFIPYSFLGAESFQAAEAAYCAMDQGKFWEYHDVLFANQTGENIGDFTLPRLNAFAKAIQLKTSDFSACLKKGVYTQKVKDDVAYGQKTGVQGTPAFSVNGQPAVFAQDLITSINTALGR